MFYFIVIFLFLFPCNANDDCPHSVSMSHNGHVNVMFGQHFNLTCNFTCLTAAHRIQLLKNKQLLSELSLSKDCPESKHTVVLSLLIPSVQHNDSGQYKCQSDPPDVISSVKVNVEELMVKDEHNASAAPPSDPPSEVKSPCNAQFSWNVPLWYMLCKMALFLICSLGVVLKKTC